MVRQPHEQRQDESGLLPQRRCGPEMAAIPCRYRFGPGWRSVFFVEPPARGGGRCGADRFTGLLQDPGSPIRRWSEGLAGLIEGVARRGGGAAGDADAAGMLVPPGGIEHDPGDRRFGGTTLGGDGGGVERGFGSDDCGHGPGEPRRVRLVARAGRERGGRTGIADARDSSPEIVWARPPTVDCLAAADPGNTLSLLRYGDYDPSGLSHSSGASTVMN